MARTFEAPQWDHYKMEFSEPHGQLEPLAHEIEVIDAALAALVDAGALPGRSYDNDRLLALRRAVREHFDIPWTAITPRMQRLLYGINAIARPAVMIAVGVFCGNTFISNSGAALGPGACYTARRLIGLEIRPEEAERARRNVAAIDPEGRAEILAADGLPFLRDFDDTIDVLYLDADGSGGRGKSIYLELVNAARHALRPGSLVLAHNSVNAASQMGDYLDFVRDGTTFGESINMVVDDQGLEVSVFAGIEP